MRATGVAREAAALRKLSMLHVWGDPLKYRDLETKLAVERFNCAIVLCDAAWVDPDQVHCIDLFFVSRMFRACAGSQFVFNAIIIH